MEQNGSHEEQWWFSTFLVFALIWGVSQRFVTKPIDTLVVLAIAVGGGYFYHRLKAKIRIKNGAMRIVVTFIILEMVAGFLIGFLTTLVNRL